MKKFLSFIGVVLIIGVFVYEQYLKTVDIDSTEDYNEIPDFSNKQEKAFYLPTSTTGAIIYHNNYTLSYSEKHEQAEWVAYQLKKTDIVYIERKRPFFEIDNAVKTKSADWRSYKKSGYDKGHLCPAADRRKTLAAYNETFLTSNISPQNHNFNGGIWSQLEQKVRYWAKSYNGVYIVTGGVLKGSLKTIGKDPVSVPDYFYKIIFKDAGKDLKMIAFLMPNKPNQSKLLQSYIVSVDKIEAETGIDFFPKLSDSLEDVLESKSDTKGWKFR